MPITWRNINGGESRGALLGLEGAGGSLDRASDAFESIFNTYGKTQEANFRAESEANTDAYLDAIAGAGSAEDLERLESDGTLEGLRNAGPIDRDAIRGQSEDRLSKLYKIEDERRTRERESLMSEHKGLVDNIKRLYAQGATREADQLMADNKDVISQLELGDDLAIFGRDQRTANINALIGEKNLQKSNQADALASLLSDSRVLQAGTQAEAEDIYMELAREQGLDGAEFFRGGWAANVGKNWLDSNDLNEQQSALLNEEKATADAEAATLIRGAEQTFARKWTGHEVAQENAVYNPANLASIDGEQVRKSLADENYINADPDTIKYALNRATAIAVTQLKEKGFDASKIERDPAYWAMMKRAVANGVASNEGTIFWDDKDDVTGADINNLADALEAEFYGYEEFKTKFKEYENDKLGLENARAQASGGAVARVNALRKKFLADNQNLKKVLNTKK